MILLFAFLTSVAAALGIVSSVRPLGSCRFCMLLHSVSDLAWLEYMALKVWSYKFNAFRC